jgi:hypothetical protein
LTVNPEKMPTLLSYLNPESNRLRMRIFLSGVDDAENGTNDELFEDFPRCDPFARFGRAAVVTDADMVLRYLLLMRQTDHYAIETNPLFPYSNPDVDRIWQEAFLRYTVDPLHSASSSLMIRIKEQVDESGKIVPFRSLFYCSHIDRFFHPPCPLCGRALVLCSDNAQLNARGLPSYSQSLKRYLWCPICGQNTENAEFYTYKRGSGDPAWVKDKSGLIHDFGSLKGERVEGYGFPCAECNERQVCYGKNRRALSRIYPYAFYPFYLFIFEGDLLGAIPFLAIVSGLKTGAAEGPTKLETSGLPDWAVTGLENRPLPQSGHFFSQTKPKRFLETLYLKLNFLFQLTNELMSSAEAPFLIDNPLLLERIWIRLPETSGRLPYFWNFTVHFFDLSNRSLSFAQLPGHPSNRGRQILGRLWFYVLLTNSRQNARAVWSEMETMLFQARSSNTSIKTLYQTRSEEPVFSPQNIYWDAEGPFGWPELWQQSLILGLRLLEADLDPGARFSAAEFMTDFHVLTEKIRHSLLGDEGSSIGESVKTASLDAAIIKELRAILRDWKRERKVATAENVGPMELHHSRFVKRGSTVAPDDLLKRDRPRGNGDDLPDTIVFSSKKKNEIRPISAAAGADDETLILKPEESRGLGNQTSSFPDDDLVEETVVLRAPETDRHRDSLETGMDDVHQDNVPETIIVSSKHHPSGNDRKTTGGREVGDRMPSETATNQQSNKKMEGDTLPKTVILRPVSKKRGEGSDD